MLFSADQVPDVDEMFAVEQPRTSDGERRRFTRAQFDALRRETNVFTDAYAVVSDVDSRLDGRKMFGTFVTGNFFQVLRVNAAIGRALTPADDEPIAGQPVMVLSHRGWDRLFARDPAILGRELLVNGVAFEIVGVMPEGFRGLAVAPDDYWAPLSMLGHVRPIHRGRRSAAMPSQRQHHRTPEAGPVAADGAGGTRRLGCRPIERPVRSSAARRTSRSCRGAALSSSLVKRCS